MAAAPLRPIIGFGSLVQTNQGWHLMGAGLGEREIGGIPVLMISLASPLGAVLKGKSAGDRFAWRGAGGLHSARSRSLSSRSLTR